MVEDAGGSRTHSKGFANLSLIRLGTAPGFRNSAKSQPLP